MILRIIRAEGIMSQADVVLATKLMASSVLSIFNSLQEQDLICEVSRDEVPTRDQKGRKPKYFKIEPSTYYAVGIDLTPHFFHLSLVDFAGNTVVDQQINIDNSMSLENLYQIIKNSMFDLTKSKRISRKKILGLGMGIPGRVDYEKGICLSSPFFQGLSNCPLGEELSELLKVPVYIHNNCSVITVSERHYRQNLKQYESLLTVLLRTGVGGGFTERSTHDNYNQVSAYEIGHIPYSMDGPICHCGARGCIETQLGEDVLVRDLDKVSVLKKLPDINDEYLENREVQKVLDNKGRLLYMTLRSVYQAVFPDTILLISRSLALSKYLAGLLEREAEQDKLLRFRVLAESYDPALYSRGAADLVWENYFI
jgi:N-acetylglucosamine repressor